MSGSWWVNWEGPRLAAAGTGDSPAGTLKVIQGTEKAGVTDWRLGILEGQVRSESI